MSEVASGDLEMPGGLSIERAQDDRGIVLRLVGELDLESAPELDRQLCELAAQSPGRLLIDLRGLEFMDSSGLAVMVRAQRSARDNGHGLALRPGPTQVQRLFELTGVVQHFTFED
ncbi:MAG TPA: STAS domain-containing protein [Solirubrobacteraceae bacterium]|jgi:anti-anti-sigma factor|nr:STAS domain-containing protein [Solirubrobacteraceae bacterium]